MSDDTYGIIRELGRDCAGAIVIQPAPDPPPPRATTNTAEPLNEDQVLQLLSNLRSSPLGASTRVRVSLAGIQEKLLLTRMTDGHWGRPVDGTPSTHILKPEAERFPNTVENEGYCMRVARHLGLRSASVETTMVGEKKVLVVERYDRKVGPGGGVERIHQEDLCQALALPPQRKYQEDGGPSLRKVADLYQSAAGPESLDDLLRTATLNVALGNGDAHGKNFSILIADDGSLKPAPLYDVLSTRPYDILDLAMYVDNVRRMHEVTLPRLVNEAASWGMSRERADAITTDVLVRLPDAMEAAREETVDLPASMLSSIQSQVTGLRA